MKFARVLSYLFHPLLMPSLALFILFQADSYFKFSTTVEYRTTFYLFLFISTFLLPFLVSFILYKSQLIKSLDMEETKERLLPLLLTLFFYICALFVMKKIAISFMIYASFLAATITIFIVFLIYLILKWKVSAHMAGLGGVIGAIISFSIKLSANMIFALMIFILIAGLLGYARLKLNAHNSGQIYTGFLIGLVTQLILIL